MTDFSLVLVLWVWTLANVGTGLAYFLIPVEMYHWTKGRQLQGLRYICLGFIVFIAACGVHHIRMAVTGNHHPSLLDAVADFIMFVASAGVGYFLFISRKLIVRIMDLVEGRMPGRLK